MSPEEETVGPQAEVAGMLWFRKFFEQSTVEADVYILLQEPKNYVMPGETRSVRQVR